MKKLLIAAALLALVGFGCAKVPTAMSDAIPEGGKAYENAQYGISLALPKDVEMRQREDAVRTAKYLGLDVDFFASLRDTVREEKAVNLAFFYAVSKMSTDEFAKALEASGTNGAVKVKSTEDLTINGVAMKRITSTTEMGEDKVHYLFDAKDSTIIVSEFIGENEEFEPILGTISVK